MAFVQKPGQGSLFPNSKEKDAQPDYRGSVNIEGKEYELAAWKKQGQKGEFLSLAAKPKQPKEEKPVQNYQASDLDQEIPF